MRGDRSLNLSTCSPACSVSRVINPAPGARSIPNIHLICPSHPWPSIALSTEPGPTKPLISFCFNRYDRKLLRQSNHFIQDLFDCISALFMRKYQYYCPDDHKTIQLAGQALSRYSEQYLVPHLQY